MNNSGITNLPNFLCIGAEKSGTTWLKHNLKDHPQIFIPPEKELHFFDKDLNFNKGLTWYQDHFITEKQAIAFGEITPGYLAEASKVAKRIKMSLPEVKLIAILRNPVDRAWSNFLMNSADGLTNKTFAQIIEERGPIIEKGYYATQIEHFREHFDQESFLILDYDMLENEPKKLLNQIHLFLNVDINYDSPRSKENIFSHRRIKNPFLPKLLRSGARLMRVVGQSKFVEKNKRNVKIWLKRNNTTKDKKPIMSGLQRKELVKIYQDDIKFLENYWGKKLGHW